MTKKTKHIINVIIPITTLILTHIFIPEYLSCFSYAGLYVGIVLASTMVGCGLYIDDNGISPMLVLMITVWFSAVDCGVFFGLLVVGVAVMTYTILDEKF